MPRKKDSRTFKSALLRLEEIVEEIESGASELEDSLRLYKEGVELAKFCGESLGDMEKEVMLLQKSAEGAFIQRPFDESFEHEQGESEFGK